MNTFKFVAVVAMFLAVYAAEQKSVGEEDGIKVYKRLIPADVLRGR